MMTLAYLYSKLFKRIRGKSILNSKIDKKAKVYSGSLVYDSFIGRYSYVGYDCEIVNCEIGNFCSIANGVLIGGAQHPMNWVSTSPVFYDAAGGTNRHLGSLKHSKTKRTKIGNDVWIGSRAIVLQGVSVGNGAVIGAGAVVAKDVPPYAVVGGVPAKVLKYRFDEHVISEMNTIEWWNMDENELIKYAASFDKPDEFLKMYHGGGGV